MKTKSAACAIGAAFLALGVGLAWYGFCKAEAINKELASLNIKQSVLGASVHQLQARIASGRSKRERQEAVLSKLQAAGRKPAGAGGKANPFALVAKNPKLLDLYLRSHRASLTRTFGSFYQMMGLSADQIDKLEDLLSKREEERMDLIATAASQGLADTDPAIAALSKQQIDQFHAAEAALLGDAGYQQFQQYNNAQGARAIVNMAAAYALDTDPYSNAQVAQVSQIIANASATYQQGGQFNRGTVDWDSAMAQASAILSPAQLNMLSVQAQFITLGKLQASYFSQQTGK